MNDLCIFFRFPVFSQDDKCNGHWIYFVVWGMRLLFIWILKKRTCWIKKYEFEIWPYWFKQEYIYITVPILHESNIILMTKIKIFKHSHLIRIFTFFFKRKLVWYFRLRFCCSFSYLSYLTLRKLAWNTFLIVLEESKR